MPNTKSALKAMKKSEKRRIYNQSYRSRMKTYLKGARLALEAALKGTRSVEDAQRAVYEACRIIDKTASKGVIKKNTAARYKSRLMHKLNSLIHQKAVVEAA
ncbi:MAG: 30S ribosomal protein S20 [Armatimonadetes bacterium]|nr:30S ribosomal protein S20 [Armatimonadota bacterium]MDW8028471.1 30S ribosomal protein S20 [Armatimonadota bacterium]